MLIIGPTMVFVVFCLGVVLFVKFFTANHHDPVVIREEQLYNREQEEYNEKLPAERVNNLPQREPVVREDRYPRRGNKSVIITDKSDREEERDSGIV